MKNVVVLLLLLFLCTGCNTRKSDIITSPVGLGSVEKGRALADGVAACGFCHGVTSSPRSPLAGGQVLTDVFGELYASNITTSDSGIGSSSIREIVKALRQSVSHEDRNLSPVVHRGYEWMSDEDAVAVASYIRSLPPIKNTIEKRDVSFWERNTVGIFTGTKAVPGSVPAVSKLDVHSYGKYLVFHVARCAECHSSETSITGDVSLFAGGKEFSKNGESGAAPSLVPGAAKEWSKGEIVQYLDRGITPTGSKINPELCPVTFFSNASKSEKEAIATYLKQMSEE